MSLSCEKEISINVVGGGLLYWSFDNVSGGNFIDSSQGVVLQNNGVAVTPAFIGNGFVLQTGFGSVNADLTPVGAPHLTPYSGQGVSHTFWCQMTLKAGTFPSEPVATVLNGVDGHQYEISFRPGLGGVIDNPQLMMIQDPFGIPATVLTVTVPIVWVVGVWHFFAFIYNQTTGKFSVSVDNGVPNVSAGTFFMPNGTWSDIHPNENFLGCPTIVVDEYLLHVAKALTATQITNLYNGGAGVTWPAAGAIVS